MKLDEGDVVPAQPVMPLFAGVENGHAAQQRSLGYALHVALKALSFESAQWASLLLSSILFGAAVWWPEPARIVAAATFTTLVHIPLWWRKA